MVQAWSQILSRIDAKREQLTDAWLDILAGEDKECRTSPFREEIRDLVDCVLQQLHATSVQPDARALGSSLARVANGDLGVLSQTHALWCGELTAALSPDEQAMMMPRIVALLGELSAGFAEEHSAMAYALQQQRHASIIDERDRTEEILRRNEAWVRIIIAGIPLILVAVDQQSIIKLIDGKTLQTLGITPAMMLGRSVEDISQNLLPGEAPPILGHFRDALQGKTFTSVGTAAGIVFETHYAPLFDDEQTIVGAVAVAIDITERTRTAAELARAHQQMTERVEAERLHLAHELHDDSLQRLLAVSYQLGLTVRGMSPTASSERIPDNVVLGRLEVARQDVLSVVRQLRVLIGELRPPALEVFGLPAALETYVERLRRTANAQRPQFNLEFDIVERELPQSIALCLFRVAQEGVRNALKHARPQTITIHLYLRHDVAALSVRDDGVGFEVPAVLSQFAWADHFGLVGLAERVEWLGGSFSIVSRPGKGTEVIARMPLA